jgi:hypothetical protein
MRKLRLRSCVGNWSRSWTGDGPGKRERAIYNCRSSVGRHDGGSKERKKREKWKKIVYI